MNDFYFGHFDVATRSKVSFEWCLRLKLYSVLIFNTRNHRSGQTETFNLISHDRFPNSPDISIAIHLHRRLKHGRNHWKLAIQFEINTLIWNSSFRARSCKSFSVIVALLSYKSGGNVFLITDPLWGESTSDQGIRKGPIMSSFGVSVVAAVQTFKLPLIWDAMALMLL